MELRIARHTDKLENIVEFYTQIMGLEVLFSFENHNDYNGVLIHDPDGYGVIVSGLKAE